MIRLKRGQVNREQARLAGGKERGGAFTPLERSAYQRLRQR